MGGPECWVIGSMAIAVSWSGHLIGTVAEITDPQAVVSAGARIVLSTSKLYTATYHYLVVSLK